MENGKPKQLTEKQEKFCRVLVETNNASEAYRQAYDCSNMKPESINRKAFEVAENVNVTARLAELRANHAKRHEITVDDLLNELEQARQLAFTTEKAAAAVTATMGKAKLLGMDKQIIEHQGQGGQPLFTGVVIK